MMKAVASRPTPAAQPKPEARALVGNTSEVKICIALPATWMKKTMMKPATISSNGAPALANTIAMMAGIDERADRCDLAAPFVERVHHEQARARHREVHREGVLQRLRDREALRVHHVR